MPHPLIVLVLLIGVLAGCEDPYQHDPSNPDRPKPSEPQAQRGENRGDNVRSRAPARDTVPAIAANSRTTPRLAVSAFCLQWTNWSWRTIERQQRRLAALATGPLAQQLTAEARVRVQDQALRRDRLGSRGHVVAIDVKRGAATRRAVCVAWEQQLSSGRADQMGARHHVYLVTVARTRDGWAVSRWQPQP
jgi:hypothetical protein